MGLRDFKTKKSFADANARGGQRLPGMGDLVEVFKFPDKKWVTLRFVGPLCSYGNHWVTTKKKDGSQGRFPAPCLSYDPATESRDATKECPWCNDESELIQSGSDYFTNAIIRSLQENEPRRKAKPTAEERKTGCYSTQDRALL